MPTKLAKKRAAERKQKQEHLESALASLPARLIHRLRKPSPILDALATKSEYLWRGFTYTDDGQPIKRADLEAIARENKKRHHQKMMKVAQVAAEDPRLINSRFGASVIGQKIRRHRDTVTRYKKLI
jgi:hypothetical protein